MLVAGTVCAQQPNIVIIDIDDMGCCDFGVYGSAYSQTPNINELALQGTRFTQFYSAAPICSPSRAGMFTGQYAARSGIHSFLNDTVDNFARDMANSLSLDAPSIARTFQDAGYATGHFGKWHLGGGRDVGYLVNPDAGTTVGAPRVVEYGYDDVWTQMEGLGNRIINVVDYAGNDANGIPDSQPRPSNYLNGLNSASFNRGTGGGLDERVYLAREFNGTFMINRAIDFIDDTRAANPNQPFFMNVWLDETHTPHDPPAALRTKYNNLYPSLPQETRDYLAVLEHIDGQIGRLVDHIDNLGLGEETLILVTSDNGATNVNANNIDSTGPFRGTKGDLFEGGFRQPLIARWTGNVAANRTDTQTVMWGPDLFPTLTQIAGIDTSGIEFDGETLSDALRGVQSQTRASSLFWNINRGQGGNHTNPNSSGAGANNQEVIAIRTGKWKLLMNAQGTAPELYDLSVDFGETNNLALQQPAVVQSMASEALGIRYETPSRILPDAVTATVRLKANDLAGLGNGAAVASWNDTATGDTFNGSVSQSVAANRPTLLTGANGLNGRAVVSFDGNDHLQSSITNSLPSVGQGITVFAVATGDTSGTAAQRLGQLGDSGGAAGGVVGLDVSTTPTSTSNGGAGFRYNNGSSLYDTPLADPETDFHIVVWQIDNNQAYADARLFVDGTTPENTFTGKGGTSTVNFSGNDLELLLGTGRLGSGAIATGDYFHGRLAEFLVFNDQLSIGQINLVANYLSTEYDLPFAYETNLSLFAVEGTAWNGGTANFSSAWNVGNGAGGPAGSNVNPFSGGNQDLYLGNNGVALFNNSTDTSAGSRVNSMRIGTERPGFIITGTGGTGTLTATGTKSLTIGSGSQPASGAETGDLIVGEAGHTGTVNWNSSGTLKVEGRLRIGENGTGVVNQDNGIITAGDVAGTQKFVAVGSGVGSSGTYNLNNGQFLPGGGISGSQLRHVRVGVGGATGVLNIGDGVGAAASASLESRDDLHIGYEGGTGTLNLRSDGRVLLSGNNAVVIVGNAGSTGTVNQLGGTFNTDADFTIGDAGGVGLYSISGGSLRTADDTAGALRIGRNGGQGTLRVSGAGSVVHEDTLTLGDGGAGTQGTIELLGSSASLTIARLDNLASGASETMRWVADASGVSSLVINGTSGTDRVQLQDAVEVSANSGTNGGGNLMGDGTALSLDLSALTGNHTLRLIDNQTTQPIVGFFENGSTGNLYEQNENIFGTGFQGSVKISYTGGTGNDVTLSLVALPGDHNGDLVVNALDYVVWRMSNIHGQQGHADWSANYGSDLGGSGSGQAGSNVPEPAALALVLGAMGVALVRLRSRSGRVVLHG